MTDLLEKHDRSISRGGGVITNLQFTDNIDNLLETI